MLAVPVLPILLIAIAASDRDSVIYPLRKLFRQSPELARVLDALGMIDEILSFHHYSLVFGGKMVLPKILECERHSLSVTEARNPLLAGANPDYVPNDILLDDTGRLLVITGPNSGGKTAYCKTVVQIQLLGQIGCYIPAATAQLVLAEHIFYQVPDPGRLDEGMGRFGHEGAEARHDRANFGCRSVRGRESRCCPCAPSRCRRGSCSCRPTSPGSSRPRAASAFSSTWAASTPR